MKLRAVGCFFLSVSLGLACLQGRVGGRPYSERMLGQVICMTEWLQQQRAMLGFSDKGAANMLISHEACRRSRTPKPRHARAPARMAAPLHQAVFHTACSVYGSCLGGHTDRQALHAAYMRQRQMKANPELRDPRAIMLLAYQHQEPPMRLPKRISGVPSPLMVAMREAIKAGLEIWQVRPEPFLSHECPKVEKQAVELE